MQNYSHIQSVCQNYNKYRTRVFRNRNAKKQFLDRLGDIYLSVTNYKQFIDEEQSEHFMALHFVKYTIYKCPRNMSFWSKIYFAIRNKIISANLPLVYTCLKKTKINYDRETLCSLGSFGLIRAVEGFDPWRGNQFSTYAWYTIHRSFAMVISTRKKIPMDEYVDPKDILLQKDKYKESTGLYIERLTRTLKKNSAGMSTAEQTVISCRFGFHKRNKKLTLKEVGSILSISKERVRQIELKALEKLKKSLASDAILQ